MNRISAFDVIQINNLITPFELLQKYPISDRIIEHVISSRYRIKKIIHGKDQRLLVVIGPCSIHDLDSAMEYANRLLILRKKYKSYLEIVMRTYFEKPRTINGWKGLIFDPDLNNSYRVNHGIEIARKLLLQINELGMPTATEFLDIITVKFIADLISWGSIGARTAESQIHRGIASSLSCPVGIKNTTDGNINIAINAIKSAGESHVIFLPNKKGRMTIYQTYGNKYTHIIMRGGTRRPNYYIHNIINTCRLLHKYNLPGYIMIDFSHGNSRKQYHRQHVVCDHICKQIREGSTAIIGIMAESFLKSGTQKISQGEPIVYGKSLTDPCLGWEESKFLLEKLALAVRSRFNHAK